MGAWDATPFGNDMAMDWVAGLESQGVDALTGAFAVATGSEYVEAPDGECGIAAAEVVASAHGKPPADLPDEVVAWVAAHRAAVPPALVAIALETVDRIDGPDSELRELWVDDAEDDQWPAAVADLRARLQSLA